MKNTMNKEEFLKELSIRVNSGEIHQKEVIKQLALPQNEVLTQERKNGSEREKHQTFSMIKIFYIVGATVIIIGISIFIYQVWNDIASFGRISVTFGLGVIFAVLGSVLLKQKEETMGSIFHLIGGVLIPLGALVVLSEFGIEVNSVWPIALTIGSVFFFYLLLSLVHKNTILNLLAIITGTTFAYLLVGAIIEGNTEVYTTVLTYLGMAIGAGYLLLAHIFHHAWNVFLVRALLFFGSFHFLLSAFIQMLNSTYLIPWQLCFLVLLSCGLAVSIFLKSRIVLVNTVLFLLIFVSYITNEYFIDSVGWPIALIVLGFIFIGLGYTAITINTKYIKRLK